MTGEGLQKRGSLFTDLWNGCTYSCVCEALMTLSTKTCSILCKVFTFTGFVKILWYETRRALNTVLHSQADCQWLPLFEDGKEFIHMSIPYTSPPKDYFCASLVYKEFFFFNTMEIFFFYTFIFVSNHHSFFTLPHLSSRIGVTLEKLQMFWNKAIRIDLGAPQIDKGFPTLQWLRNPCI